MSAYTKDKVPYLVLDARGEHTERSAHLGGLEIYGPMFLIYAGLELMRAREERKKRSSGTPVQ